MDYMEIETDTEAEAFTGAHDDIVADMEQHFDAEMMQALIGAEQPSQPWRTNT